MDELEKSLIAKYGSSKISSKDIAIILDTCSKNGLIDKKEVKELDSMNSSDLLEHISKVRRSFLIDSDYDFESNKHFFDSSSSNEDRKGVVNEEITDRQNKIELENIQKIKNRVLRSFVDYEKVKTNRSRGFQNVSIIIIILVFVVLYSMYTPTPN